MPTNYEAALYAYPVFYVACCFPSLTPRSEIDTNPRSCFEVRTKVQTHTKLRVKHFVELIVDDKKIKFFVYISL